jgi:hypothetical protein
MKNAAPRPGHETSDTAKNLMFGRFPALAGTTNGFFASSPAMTKNQRTSALRRL